MNAEIKAKWCQRLRDDKDNKCTGTLKNGCRMCAMGELCQLYHEETGLGVWYGGRFQTSSDDSFYILPIEVKEWAGLSDSNPSLANGHTVGYTNDDLKMPFPDLADLIESTTDL